MGGRAPGTRATVPCRLWLTPPSTQRRVARVAAPASPSDRPVLEKAAAPSLLTGVGTGSEYWANLPTEKRDCTNARVSHPPPGADNHGNLQPTAPADTGCRQLHRVGMTLQVHGALSTQGDDPERRHPRENQGSIREGLPKLMENDFSPFRSSTF